MLTDAGPLIYLAKIDALDVFQEAGYRGMVTPVVERETARAALAYRYPDALLIATALRDGRLERVDPSAQEEQEAQRLMQASGGLHRGECEVLAIGDQRGFAVLLHERQAMRVAAALGLEVWSPVELLFQGTRDAELLEQRIRSFARLVEMRLTDVEALLELARRRQR